MTVELPDLGAGELDAMRVVFAFAVLVTVDGLRFFRPRGERSEPVGLARFLDVAALARPRPWHRAAQVAALAVAVDVALGWAMLVLATYLVVQVTARSSEGSVNHGDHLVCVVAVAQAAGLGLWDAAERWGWDVGGWVAGSRATTAAWWAIQATLAVYFTSGLAKVLATSGRWIARSPSLLLAATGRLEMAAAMGARTSPVTRRLVERLLVHPGVARALFGAGLLVELAAPVGLLGTVPLAAVGAGLLLLHEANRWLLGLPFPTYQLVVLAFLVVPAGPW